MQKGKNKDLLKEAIADAKSVRETALKNAKLALEEAFTPKLQSMLSAKLQKEVEGDDEDLDDVDIDMAEEPVDGEEEVDMEFDTDDEEIDEDEVSSDIGTQEFPTEQPETEDPGEDELTEDDDELDLDIEDDELPIEEPVSPETEEDELDLEAIIRELDDENTELDADVEFEGDPEVTDEPIAEPETVEDDDDEDIDISMTELYKALKEIEGEDLSEPYDAEGAPEVEPVAIEEEEELQTKVDDLEQENGELEQELGEAYKVVKFLKSKLNEVNLINAKLLFTTKLFRSFDLSQTEKIKVVETLDRASNAREAKLVFVTLAESYGKNKTKKVISKPVKKLTETIARASKTQLTTKPKPEILSESDDMVARFRKLANITKK